MRRVERIHQQFCSLLSRRTDVASVEVNCQGLPAVVAGLSKEKWLLLDKAATANHHVSVKVLLTICCLLTVCWYTSAVALHTRHAHAHTRLPSCED